MHDAFDVDLGQKFTVFEETQNSLRSVIFDCFFLVGLWKNDNDKKLPDNLWSQFIVSLWIWNFVDKKRSNNFDKGNEEVIP